MIQFAFNEPVPASRYPNYHAQSLPDFLSLLNIDDRNDQNRNAGNGGDLIKHTVYLTLLETLTKHEPWRSEIRLRECHAGRGLYLTTPDNEWLGLYLHNKAENSILARSQRSALSDLRVDVVGRPGALYVGSSVLNLRIVASARKAFAEFYELKPRTREILQAVLREARPDTPGLTISVPGRSGRNLDGETHIADSVKGWDQRDLILLDPFSMWRQLKHQRRRDLYRDILVGAVENGCPVTIFFTWGNANREADEDLSADRVTPMNGYGDLFRLLKLADVSVVTVKWIWRYRFAMWIVLPGSGMRELRDDIAASLRREVSLIDRLSDSSAIGRLHPDTVVDVV
jgi:hypothetical protein